MRRQHIDILLIQQMRHTVRRGAVVEQTALLGSLFDPAFIIAVAVEDNVLVILDGLPNHLMQRRFKISRTFQAIRVNPEGFSHGAVQHDVRTGNAVGGTEHTELKLVAGKGKRRSSVAVSGVTVELRQHISTQLHLCLFSSLIGRTGLDCLQHRIQLITKEDGNNSGRRFVGTEPVIIACSCHRYAQKILIIVHGLDDGAQEQQELCVFIGGRSGRKKILSGVGGDGPVVVLTAAIDSGKRLFVEQADKPMPGSYLLHDLHGELIVVGGDIGGGVDRGKLVLSRCDLVVFRLGQNAKLPEFGVEFFHICSNSRLDYSKIMIIHLLALGRLCTKQRAAGKTKVRPLIVHLLGDEEVFLLGTDRAGHTLYAVVAKQPEDPKCLLVERFHGTEQRGLFVQGMTAIGAERSRNAQRLTLDERIGGRIPGGIASCFKGGAKSAAGERGGIRFPLDEFLAGEFHDHTAVG